MRSDNEILEAQAAYFRSDQRIRDAAVPWIGVPPEVCLRAVHEACEEAAFFLRRLSPDELDRALERDPLSEHTQRLLEQLWASRKR